MYIERIWYQNWMRYAGKHQLELEPKVYGIVGEWLGDDGRSNWVGKSIGVEGIPFVLLGDHRKRTEDEWITMGEEHGEVGMVLSNGDRIYRERDLGKSTKLIAETKKKGKCAGDEAQRYINDEILGCTKEEFYLLYFAKQKALSEIVMMRPEPFADTIRKWVGTEPLERVEEEATRLLGQVSLKVRDYEQTIQRSIEDVLGDSKAVSDPVGSLEVKISELEQSAKKIQQKVNEAKLALKQAREVQESCSTWYEHRAALATVEGMRSELDQLDRRIAEFDLVEIKTKLENAERADQKLDKELHRQVTQRDNLEAISNGAFDGRCPVMDAPCPVTKHVLDAGLSNKEKLVRYMDACKATKSKKAMSRNVLESCRDRLRTLEVLEGKRDTILKTIEKAKSHQRYLDEHPEPSDKASITQAVVDAEGRLSEARLALQSVESELGKVNYRLGQVRAAKANVDEAKTMMARYNRIRCAAGRQGAQRDIALTSMQKVERLGNSLLSDANIPLSFRVRWTAEGKKLTAVCDSCGYSYTGQRDKNCPRCGVERSMHALDRPGLELSDRSGAAEDLVGASVRLGAGAWLRDKRIMPWSVAVVDEPYGALDETNRESFSRYLITSLRGRFGFEQSFIIAHHPDVMATMPGRIRVVGTQHGSRIEVVY